jgi:ribonuclease P protein component
MAKKLALTRRAQYLAVYKSGKASADNLLVVKCLANGMDITRTGFSVTKETGKATVRNRIKRLLRESVRIMHLKPGWDIVFIARKGIIAADYHTIGKSMCKLLGKSALLQRNVETISPQID